MYIPLPTPKEMANWDKLSIQDFGISGEILMENASRQALSFLQSKFENLRDKKILLLAGSGNNGGDAFALARHLSDTGAECSLLHTRNLDEYQGESAYHVQLARKANIELFSLKDFNLQAFEPPDIIVDGLLGTGFQGELRQDYLQWIQAINELKERCFILAIDIPSGLNGLTGKPGPTAVRAHWTVTFEAAKTGLFLPEASEYVGHLHVSQIGIPRSVRENNPPGCFGLNEDVFQFLPRDDPLQHKGKAGHLLILGGSPGLTGATTLAALGALRSGTGLVTVGCPKSLITDIKQGWPEIMTLPLGGGEKWAKICYEELSSLLGRFDAVVFGPGLGRDDGAREFVQNYLSGKYPPTVFDADALFWLAQDKNLWSNLQNDSILTPHPGEMARLCDKSVPDILQDRLQSARTLADETGCTLVLKGPGTVVAKPAHPVHISPFACANLAVGGSGDVLSGIMGSLLARSVESLSAACLAVYWHGLAGTYLQQAFPGRGNLAQDIAHVLPDCLAERRFQDKGSRSMEEKIL